MLETPDLYLEEYETKKINVFADLYDDSWVLNEKGEFSLMSNMWGGMASRAGKKNFLTEEEAINFLKTITYTTASSLSDKGTIIFYALKIIEKGEEREEIILGKKTFKIQSFLSKLEQAPEIN